ncbi:MAG: hypothetical protein LQ346_008435 [Caloplaca aetnensis]|nr:MAG: hypothetical protein LQ346_008435 [Caloplaca aetnensis]
MVNYSNVKQGTGQFFGAPDPPEWVGTDGAVTCLAIYLYHVDQGVFVAHADCAVQVTGPGPEFDYVRDEFAGKLAAALGPFDGDVHTDIQCFSGGTDQALEALKQGLEQWAGFAPPFSGQDSFKVKTDGSGMTWVKSRDTPEEIEGPLDMSVPVQELPSNGE